jgi:hypothetical protein
VFSDTPNELRLTSCQLDRQSSSGWQRNVNGTCDNPFAELLAG